MNETESKSVNELRACLGDLVEGRSMDRSIAEHAMKAIIDPETPDALIASFLSLIRVKGPTSEEIAGFVDCLAGRNLAFPVDDKRVVDTCGTGGDGKNTFNISTTAALVAAAAGAPLVKHGNRAASGVSGSADLLQRLGIPLDVDVEEAKAEFERTGFVFLFAPRYHPALGRVAPIRRTLGFPTVFNLLGPLLNPANVTRQLLGVSHPDLIALISQTLLLKGVAHAIVLHGEGGYDEATPVGPLRGRRIRGDVIEPFYIDPKELGIPRCEPGDLEIRDVAHSEAITRAIFEGERSARRDAVVLNAGLTLQVSLDIDLEEGIEKAAQALDQGLAKALVESLSRAGGSS